ncbi:MAG: carboxypeptidase regulatory-like domain-containing protein [Sandaracinaceae bacterium]|nr:carboxypeptidase regulatory-like domain-containing protein [Sandaracinaceae bacterium]
MTSPSRRAASLGLLALGIAAGVAACDDAPDARVEDPGDPPFPLGGRVVSPAGAGLPGARVELVSWTAGAAPRVVERARTAADGAFLFDQVDVSRAYHALVIEHGGVRRTFVPDLPPEAFRETRRGGAPARAGVVDLRVRIGPVRVLPVRLRCTEPPREASAITTEPSTRPGLAPRLTVFWGPGTDDVWWSRSAGAPEPADAVLPHWEVTRPAFTGSARELELTVPLPVGEHTIRVDGGCGVDVRVVEVTEGEAPLPALEIELPHPESGALEIHLAERECASPPCRWGPEQTPLARGPIELGPVPLRPGATTRVDRLPPGEHRLGPASCERRVEVRAGATTTVELGADACESIAIPPL